MFGGISHTLVCVAVRLVIFFAISISFSAISLPSSPLLILLVPRMIIAWSLCVNLFSVSSVSYFCCISSIVLMPCISTNILSGASRLRFSIILGALESPMM